MIDFQMKMRQWFGWDGVILIWDVKSGSKSPAHAKRFESVENIIYHVGTNPTVVNQIFSKIDDMDIIDIYTPLKSLYDSNRYDLIKKNVIK